MNTRELQRIYDFMKENAAVVSSIFAASDIPGPEPGVCLEGSKGIWRPFTDEEIEGLRTGNPEMLSKHINCKYIGNERSEEDRMKDKIPGEGDYRPMNEEELAQFREKVCPGLAAIAFLYREGLLKEIYFDDEGDSLDHYKRADNILGILGFGMDPAVSVFDGFRMYVSAMRELPDGLSELYERLDTDVGNRDPEKDRDLIGLDETISSLWGANYIRQCIEKDYKTLMERKDFSAPGKEAYFSVYDLVKISGAMTAEDTRKACDRLTANGFLSRAPIEGEDAHFVYIVQHPERLPEVKALLKKLAAYEEK
jgi:hypothetical protein